MTMKKFHPPPLHSVAAWHGLDEPSRGSRIMSTDPRHIRAHENARASPALGSQLQPPGFNLAQTFNKRDGRADPATPQTLGQRPQLVRTILAPQKDQMPKVDPRGRYGGQVKLSLWITPRDGAIVFLRGVCKQ